jgi:hypothetical protein
VFSSQHSGVWEMSKTDGCPMWSDTGSFEYYSPGDLRSIRRVDASNYAPLEYLATSGILHTKKIVQPVTHKNT